MKYVHIIRLLFLYFEKHSEGAKLNASANIVLPVKKAEKTDFEILRDYEQGSTRQNPKGGIHVESTL